MLQMSEEASPRFGPKDEVIDDRENEGCPMQTFILDGGGVSVSSNASRRGCCRAAMTNGASS